jgi:hypothetical protein
VNWGRVLAGGEAKTKVKERIKRTDAKLTTNFLMV